jgi:hypothetical protein
LAQLLTTTDHDSGALGGTATVVHPLREVGTWELLVGNAGHDVLATVELRVRDDAPTMQATVDLVAAARLGQSEYAGEPVQSMLVRTGGYLQLQAPAVEREWYARLPNQWDSRVLQSHDKFVCLPLRPGRYVLAN